MNTASIRELIHGCGLARTEALALMENACGRSREWLIAHDNDCPDRDVHALFGLWVERRKAGQPVAYLVGWREFYGRRFWVNRHTLIPRIDTELLMDTALPLLQSLPKSENALRVADLGTGSGCIAISLALSVARPIEIIATDQSPQALQVARNNAAWLGASDRIRFAQGSWWQALHAHQRQGAPRFHAVISNPPYIAARDPHLSQGDLRFEPAAALSNANGLIDIEAIAAGCAAWLVPRGWLLIEHGFDQQPAVCDIFLRSGLIDVRGLADLAGRPRAVLGFHP